MSKFLDDYDRAKIRLVTILRAEWRLKQRMETIDFERDVVMPAVAKLEEMQAHMIVPEFEGVTLTEIGEWLQESDAAIAAHRAELEVQVERDRVRIFEAEVEKTKREVKQLTAKVAEAKKVVNKRQRRAA